MVLEEQVEEEQAKEEVNDDFVENDTEEKGQEEASSPPPKTTLQDHSTSEYAFVVILGLCMAFTAGYSNGVALSGFIHVDTDAVKSTVAGVTGAYTASAIAVGERDWSSYRFAVGTLFSVMAGSTISSVFNPCPIAFELSPRYGTTFVVGSMFSALGAVAALHNFRREFYFTAIGNGIMNGVSSMYSANLIRTTHLTGTTTDIGLFVGQWMRGNRTNNWKLYILSGLAASFWIGSLAGYEAARFKRQYALIFNAVFFFVLGCSIIVYFVVVHKLSLCDALFGLGKFGVKFEKFSVTRQSKDGDAGEEVSEEELMELYDELDAEHAGRVNQDQLVDLLASRDLEVRKQRKSIIGLLHMAFEEHDDTGDWTVNRDDWRKLVHRQDRSKSAPPSSIASASSRRATAGTSSARSSIAALRNASILQIESSGLRVVNDEKDE